MDRYKIAAWFAVVISTILLILPRILPICNGLAGGTEPMQCHYAYQAEFIVTLLAVILSGSLLVLRTAEARLLAGFVIFLLGIVIVVIPQPWAIGICPHMSSPCHKTTFFETIGASLLIIAGGIITALNYKLRKEVN